MSQSAYSPSSPDTPDSRFSGSPHMMLSKPGPPLPPLPPLPPPPPSLMTLPPTQPTAKVLTCTYCVEKMLQCKRHKNISRNQFLKKNHHFLLTIKNLTKVVIFHPDKRALCAKPGLILQIGKCVCGVYFFYFSSCNL